MNELNLVHRGPDGEPATDSHIIAEGTGSQHGSVIRLIRDNVSDFEEFGGVGFQIRPFETAGGRQERTVAILNREQAMLLMTYMRNNEIVRDFKKRLIRAFSELERAAAAPALSGKELMAAALIEAQETMHQLESTTQRQAAELEQAAPKVEYHDRFISEDSDVLTIDDWAAQYGIKKGTGLALLRDKKIIYRKAVTREMSKKKGEQVDRMEHRAYAPHFHMFDLRPQLKAPRYNNGQMRQTLYVRVAFSTQLAKESGINAGTEGLF